MHSSGGGGGGVSKSRINYPTWNLKETQEKSEDTQVVV